jgi:hypothetical protein
MRALLLRSTVDLDGVVTILSPNTEIIPKEARDLPLAYRTES